MRCPNCGAPEKALVKECQSCGEAFSNEDLLEFHNLEFLINQTAGWEVPESVIQPYIERLKDLTHRLERAEVVSPEIEAVPADLPELVGEVEEVEPAEPEAILVPEAIELPESATRTLAHLKGVYDLMPTWIRDEVISMGASLEIRNHLAAAARKFHPDGLAADIPLPEVTPFEIREYILNTIDEWVRLKVISTHVCNKIRNYLTPVEVKPVEAEAAPVPVEVPSEVITPIAEAPVEVTATEAGAVPEAILQVPPTPQPIPEPKRPTIQFDKIWERVVEAAVSGLLLRWLRYLGAFLFVVSLAIVVINFWNDIPQWGQVFIIFFIPAVFYFGGWYARRRLKIEQTGAVLMGVGELLLAVDFAAIYQFGELTVELSLYWLVTSAICTMVYLYTVWRQVQTEFFGYIGLVGVSSTLMALVLVLTETIEWPLVALAGLATISVETSHRLKSIGEQWNDVARSAQRFPQMVIPLVLGTVFFIPSEGALYAGMCAFALATVTSVILSQRYPHLAYTFLAVAFSLCTVGTALWAVELPLAWFPSAAAILSPFYIVFVSWLGEQMDESTLNRKYHLLAFKLAGYGLLILACVLGIITAIIDVWPGVIALTLASMVMAGYAVLLKQPLYILLSGSFSLAPYSFAAYELLANLPQTGDWLMSAWSVLALLYLGITALLRGKPDYTRWLNLVAQIIPLVAFFIMGVLALDRGGGSSIPPMSALGGFLVFYLVSACLHHSGKHPAVSKWLDPLPVDPRKSIFLYPIGILIPVITAVGWGGSTFVPQWIGPVLAGTGTAYAVLGQLLRRLHKSYRFPFHLLAYILGGISLVALGNSGALMTAMYINVATLVILAVIYNRLVESSIAALLFLWPFQLTLTLINVLPHAHSLANILLASLGYIPLGILFKRRHSSVNHHLPLWGTGYAVSVYALVVSLSGRFGIYTIDLQWVGVVVPLIATALYATSAYLVHPGFRWAAAAVFPISFGQALTLFKLPPVWDSVAWVGLGVLYLIAGWVSRVLEAGREPAPRIEIPQADPISRLAETLLVSWELPQNFSAWVLGGLGLALTLPVTRTAFFTGEISLDNAVLLTAPMIAQGFAILFVVLAAVQYRSRWPLFLEPILAFLAVTLLFIGYGEAMFKRALTSPQFGILWAGLGFFHVILAASIEQNKKQRVKSYMHGIYLGGYILVLLAIFWALRDRVSLLWALGSWVLLCTASAFLVHFRRHIAWQDIITALSKEPRDVLTRSVRSAFIWLAAWTLPVWLFEFLTHLQVLAGYQWLGFTMAGLGYLLLTLWLRKFDRVYTWPLHLAAHTYNIVGLIISLPFTLITYGRGELAFGNPQNAMAFILLQVGGVVLYTGSAIVFRKKALGYTFSYLAAVLSFFPYTLWWIVFGGDLLGRQPTRAEYAVIWMAFAGLLLGIGACLDRSRTADESLARKWESLTAHGPYAGGYALSVFALVWGISLWSQRNQIAFLWALGLWTLWMTASAVLVHLKGHHSLGDVLKGIFGSEQSTQRQVASDIFIWIAAWSLPVWVTLLLWRTGVLTSFGYLGYGLTSIGLIIMAVWLRRLQPTYAWPLVLSGQFYTFTALMQTVSPSGQVLTSLEGYSASEKTALLGFILVQGVGIVYYAITSWFYQAYKWVTRIYSYISAGLLVIPYTASWIAFRFEGIQYPLGYAWIALSAILLGIGFILDMLERRAAGEDKRVGFAHGPYLVGYLLLGYSFFWTIPSQLVHIYTFAGCILLLVLSHGAVHFKRHNTWADFAKAAFGKTNQITRDVVRGAFLWLSAYTFPIWLVRVLAYNQVPLPWRGLALALTAPIYIAVGLGVRRVDHSYAWPLYSAGYLLTAIGAMVSFEDQLLTIYVLSLNVLVYAVSAYIFRQSAWLYFSNLLVPVISLIILEYNFDALPLDWVSGLFMGMAFLYLGIGQTFDRLRRSAEGVSSYALPFYTPAYLLSAIALASASGDKELAIVIYLLGVVFFSTSAWAFRESVFLYPAVWLAAVPYYLGMTYTRLLPSWYGIGWMPLILGAILMGKFAFHRKPIFRSLTHPALPFYSLAYTLSISMMLIARGDMTALAVAFWAAAALYIGSAGLFRKALWLYPGLAAAHLGLFTTLSIESLAFPSQYMALPFLAMTWVIGLTGGALIQRNRRGSAPGVGTWGIPLLVFTAIDIILWQIVSFSGFESGIILATGNALLLGILAVMWVNSVLAWGSLGFLTLGFALRLAWSGADLPVLGAIAAGVGFGTYLVARLVEVLVDRQGSDDSDASPKTRFSLWSKPLIYYGIGINAIGAVIPLFFIISHTTQAAAGLAFAGAVYLAIAYRNRYHILGYAAVAMLELALILLLITRDVQEPQWYAIPAGVYFVGVSVFERRRKRPTFALVVENLGFTVLLLTSFIQSMNLENGFWYFLILLVEGLLIMVWAASQRRKIPFLVGLATNVVNVMGQIVVVFMGGTTLIRWLIFGGVGLVLLVAALLAERWILPRAREFREQLEQWE